MSYRVRNVKTFLVAGAFALLGILPLQVYAVLIPNPYSSDISIHTKRFFGAGQFLDKGEDNKIFMFDDLVYTPDLSRYRLFSSLTRDALFQVWREVSFCPGDDSGLRLSCFKSDFDVTLRFEKESLSTNIQVFDSFDVSLVLESILAFDIKLAGLSDRVNGRSTVSDSMKLDQNVEPRINILTFLPEREVLIAITFVLFAFLLYALIAWERRT
jgi:hypothetical protein